MRSTTHGISKENSAKQFHRDYLDFLPAGRQVCFFCIKTKDEELFFYAILLYKLNRNVISTERRMSDEKSQSFLEHRTTNIGQHLILILFCLIKKYSKNQDLLLFFYNSTFYVTIESRPQALWILAVS